MFNLSSLEPIFAVPDSDFKRFAITVGLNTSILLFLNLEAKEKSEEG